jgi:signal transduction histidine kinase
VTITGSEDGTCVTEAGELPSLRMLCHDLIEPAATIRLLARAASTDLASESATRDRLRLIADEAAQIALICEHVLGAPEPGGGVRLDQFACGAVASARSWYPGLIDTVTEPVTVPADPATVIRILSNVLTNACRAAGPGGHVRLVVDEADGQARLSVADSGSGLGTTGPGAGYPGSPGRARLGLEIIGRLALGSGGTVRMGVSDLGGLAVTVCLPAERAR